MGVGGVTKRAFCAGGESADSFQEASRVTTYTETSELKPQDVRKR